jgi:hypothetical protein
LTAGSDNATDSDGIPGPALERLENQVSREKERACPHKDAGDRSGLCIFPSFGAVGVGQDGRASLVLTLRINLRHHGGCRIRCLFPFLSDCFVFLFVFLFPIKAEAMALYPPLLLYSPVLIIPASSPPRRWKRWHIYGCIIVTRLEGLDYGFSRFSIIHKFALMDPSRGLNRVQSKNK